MRKIIPFMVAVMVLMTGCKSAKVLEGNWETTALIKEGVYQEIAVSNVEFKVSGTKVSVGGCSGVNVFSGTIKADDKNIKGDGFAVTKMMGDPRVMEFEDMFLEAMSFAESYEIKDGLLVIKAPSKKMELQFVKKM
ncbi:MAG: META domain-containing protein [Treponema sp.]|nr:META domain-containing protein [Treponema sp.]